ncbi:PAS domain-containing protein, partial [Patescibacteria group bacterium]|nr:PAS domain-containing protein [Patescibacteria group bacterium]
MSLKIKLLLLIITTLFTVGFSGASFIYIKNNQKIAQHTNSDIENTINYTFQLVNAYFGRVSGITENLAKDNLVVSAIKEKNLDKYNQIIDKFSIITESNTIIERLLLFELVENKCIVRAIDKNGMSIINANFSDRDYCKGILKNNSLYISSAFIGTTTKHPNIAIVSPIKNEEGSMIGFVLGAVNVQELRGYLWDLQNNSKIEILDRYGVMFLNTSEKITELSNLDQEESTEINQILSNLENGKNQGAYNDGSTFVGYKSNGIFTVIFEKSQEELGLLQKDINLTVFLAQFVSILLTSLIIYFFVGKITKKISNLSKIAKQISEGNLTVKLDKKNNDSKDEVSILETAFAIMSTKLANIYKGLERKIEERTEDIAEAEARDKAILTSIGEAVVACDIKGNIFLFNTAASSITKFSINEVINVNYKKILKFVIENADNPSIDFISEAMRTSKLVSSPLNTKIMTKDKNLVSVSSIASPILNESKELIGCVIIFRDTTIEKQVDRAKTEFVSLASHQLRTPLASINWTAEMLLSNDFGKVTKEQKNSIDTIRKSGKRMASLISALLNVSRIEMGSFEVNTLPVIIPDLIDESLKELETELNLKKAKFIKKYKKEVYSINADPVLLKIVVLNLLSNALRYCEKGSKITITLDKNTTDILFSV